MAIGVNRWLLLLHPLRHLLLLLLLHAFSLLDSILSYSGGGCWVLLQQVSGGPSDANGAPPASASCLPSAHHPSQRHQQRHLLLLLLQYCRPSLHYIVGNLLEWGNLQLLQLPAGDASRCSKQQHLFPYCAAAAAAAAGGSHQGRKCWVVVGTSGALKNQQLLHLLHLLQQQIGVSAVCRSSYCGDAAAAATRRPSSVQASPDLFYLVEVQQTQQQPAGAAAAAAAAAGSKGSKGSKGLVLGTLQRLTSKGSPRVTFAAVDPSRSRSIPDASRRSQSI